MATINFYQRRQVSDALPGISQGQRGDPVAAAVQGLGQVLGSAGAEQQSIDVQRAHQEAMDARRKLENQAAVDVSNTLSQGDVYWQDQLKTRTQAWKPGDPDLRDGVAKDFDKWVQESAAKLTTDSSKKFFLQHTAQMRARMQMGLSDFQQKATTDLLNANTAVGEADDERNVASNWKDEKFVDGVITRRTEAIFARTDLSEADKVKEANRVKLKMTLARERAFIEADPAGWLKQNGTAAKPGKDGQAGAGAPGAAGGFDAQVSAVLQREGGYVANDGGSGAPANFGINQKANPDVDVAKLTPEKAKEIYKARYWDPIGADGLSPQMQGTAFDAAVNQGVGWTKKALAEAGGDVEKFNELRRARYREIANSNPEKAQYLMNWMARVDQSSQPATTGSTTTGAATAGAAGGDPFQLSRFASRLDPDQVYQLRNLAETRVSQANAQAVQDGQRLLSDLMAAHRDGVVEPVALDRTFFDRFGADGTRVYDQYAASRQMGADIASYAAKPTAEIQADLAASKPMEAGAGYQASDGRYNAKMQAAAHAIKRRNDDPVTYSIGTSPKVRELADRLTAGQLTPEQRRQATEQFLDATLAEQVRLGVEQPKMLTPAKAERWAQMAMKATRPEDSANLISTLETEYGKHFPRVFNELAREGKLSGELLIIPNLPSQASRELVSRLARVKESELAGTVPPDAVKGVRDKVQEHMVDLAKTIPYATEQSAGMLASYESTMKKIAYERIAAGTSPGDAVDQALKTILGHYELKDGVRFPAKSDVSGLRKEMGKTVDGLKPEALQLPFDTTGVRSVDEQRKMFADLVKSRPVWHTTDDDKGVQLYVVQENGVKLPVIADGRPVRKTWAELQAPMIAKQAERDARAQRTEALRQQVQPQQIIPGVRF